MDRATIYILLAFAVGMLIPVQSSINAYLGQMLKHPLHATFVNFLGGALFLIILLLFVFKVSLPSFSQLANVPWYLLIGGILGVTFVSSVILLTPRVGITNFLVASMAGQLILSLAIDHYGWFGLPVHRIDPMRLAGIACLIVGIILTNK